MMRTPIDLRKDCVSASVEPISSENTSLPDIDVNGVSEPSACERASWHRRLDVAFEAPGKNEINIDILIYCICV